MEDKEDYKEVGNTFEVGEDWSMAGLLEFANTNNEPDKNDYKKKLMETVGNWKGDEVKIDYGNNNDYVLAKNENKNEMYVMFRRSQTFND